MSRKVLLPIDELSDDKKKFTVYCFELDNGSISVGIIKNEWFKFILI